MLNNLINPAAGSPRSRFEISVDGTAFVPVDLAPWSSAEINAATMANVRDRFQDRINGALDSVSPAANVAVTSPTPVAALATLLTFTSDGATSTLDSVRIRRASDRDIAEPLMLGVEQGGIEPVRYSNFRPAPSASILRLGDPANPGTLATLNALSVLPVNQMLTLTINGQRST